MSFRTIIISSHSKLEYSLNCLVFRTVDKEIKIFLSEISCLILQNYQISLTSALMSELAKRNIRVIFCDNKHNPIAQLYALSGTYDSAGKFMDQFNFSKSRSGVLWTEIVKQKISNQSHNIALLGKDNNALEQLRNSVLFDDQDNREAVASKIYFRELFGDDFTRDMDNSINKFLDYGYSLLLSSIGQAIKACGYLTEIGVHHRNRLNNFNLCCDFMEPLRPLIDYQIITGKINDDNFKKNYIKLFTEDVSFSGQIITLENAILKYVQGLFRYLNQETEIISFIEYENS